MASKTRIAYDILGDYGQGFELVTGAEDREDARRLLAEYRENEPGIRFRIKRTYEVLPEYTEELKQTLEHINNHYKDGMSW